MIIELVIKEIEKGLDEYAKQILSEEKAIVGAHRRSGKAVASLRIQKTGEFSRFIGAQGGEGALHAYFLDEGNGGKVITPKRGKALKYSDGSYHPRSKPYKGIHWTYTVASHY